MHKTAAWPLALIYVALVVYASLYPFQWSDTGAAPWDFLSKSFPRYWTGFDVALNVVGYAPLGGLLSLTVLRTGKGRSPIWLPLLCCLVLSLTMESLQNYLPARVASKEDWFLNTLGAWTGAVVTLGLEKLGAIDHWSRFRKRWFAEPSRGGIVLLATWPMALLFPAAVPFGLGQVLARVHEVLADWFEDTPFIDWLPLSAHAGEPLSAGGVMSCVVLGLLIPSLLGFSVIHAPLRRLVFVWVVVVVGMVVSGLSAALTWGPEHAWAWMDLPTQLGLGIAWLLATALCLVPWRASAALAVLALGIYLSVLNQAPESPYFAQTLQAWEQGKFIRFNGLAQWLGWLWPYAALGYVLSLMWRRDTKN
jgi:VanZ family protein